MAAFSEAFRAYLQRYLEEHDMSVRELSRISGVSYPTVYSFVMKKPLADNRRTITLESAEKLAAAVGRVLTLMDGEFSLQNNVR